MNRFLELFRHHSTPPPGQIYADDRSHLFPQVVALSPRLRLWSKQDRVPTRGRFLLVGVATWSGYDMKLLDALEQTDSGPDLIGVFDTADCKSNEDFNSRIPGIGDVFQMPAVGLWENGTLVARGSGHEGRQIAFLACGLDAGQISSILKLDPLPA